MKVLIYWWKENKGEKVKSDILLLCGLITDDLFGNWGGKNTYSWFEVFVPKQSDKRYFSPCSVADSYWVHLGWIVKNIKG